MDRPLRLAGKVALVVGSGPRTTRAVSLLFAREGARVALLARRSEHTDLTARWIREQGGQAITLQGDAMQDRDVARAVGATVESFGRLDILYNNVGGGFTRPDGQLDGEEERFTRGVLVNLLPIYHCYRHAVPAMIQGGGGCIINVTSTPQIRRMGAGAFAAGRSGIVALSRLLAKEHAKDNIRVNCISLGRLRGEVDPSDLAPITQPLSGRVALPLDIAYAALFLASDEASWISGIDLPVDGAAGVS